MTKPHGRPLPSAIFGPAGPNANTRRAEAQPAAPEKVQQPKPQPTQLSQLVTDLGKSSLNPTLLELMKEMYRLSELCSKAQLRLAELEPLEQTVEILQAKVAELKAEVARLKGEATIEAVADEIVNGARG